MKVAMLLLYNMRPHTILYSSTRVCNIEADIRRQRGTRLKALLLDLAGGKNISFGRVP